MSVLIIVSTLICLEWASSASVGVMDTCKQPGFSDGNYAHPDNCTQFIQCNNAVTIVLDCPGELVFNEDKRLCDQLSNVPRCQPTTTQDPLTTTMNFSDIFDTCKVNGYVDGAYIHPSDCQKYLQCNGGVTSIVDCPGDLVFNEIRRLCDNIDNVPRCQPPTTPMPTGTPSTDIMNTCNLPGHTEGLFLHPTDCHKYILCLNGTTNIMDCPTGLVYNEAKKFCDLIMNVARCQHGHITTIRPGGYNTYCMDNNLATGIHPDPFSCTHFIECTFGRTDHMACPDGLAFDVQALTCVDKPLVDCSHDIGR